MTTDLLRRLQAWTEGALSRAGTQLMVAEFVETPVWFPGLRQAAPAGGHAVQRLHLFPGDPGELPTLAVWLADPAGLQPPVAAATLHQTGGALLSHIASQRFNAVLDGDGERCLLTCDDLLSLRALMIAARVAAGHGVTPTDPPDVARLLPPLRAYCAGEPSVQRAWLALVHSAASSQATVLLETGQPDRHRAALTDALDPLLPPGVSLTVLDLREDAAAPVCAAIARAAPVHQAGARPNWVDRLRQRLTAPGVPVIPVELRD